MYYRNAQAALVVYDLTKPTSLIKAKHWVAELQRQASPGIVIALVGNKLDLTKPVPEGGSGDIETGAEQEGDAEAEDGDARKISTKEGRDYAEEESLLFFETSAKSGTNVQEVFTAIANGILSDIQHTVGVPCAIISRKTMGLTLIRPVQTDRVCKRNQYRQCGTTGVG